MSDQRCVNCQKTQSELSNPLKVCAKCHTQSYCSRDCQKAHWKTHKKECGKTPGEPTPGSLTNPPKDEVLERASETISLMKILTKCDGFNYVLRDMDPSVAGLMYLADFAQRTFRDYWQHLLPYTATTDFMVECAAFWGQEIDKERKRIDAKTEQLRRDHPEKDLDAWPERFDSEKYSDACSRTWMAATIVLDQTQQSMMGGKYDYPDEAKELCRRILGDRWPI